ncbi:malate dehydrogenase, putative [Plasmodium relictum]|uniref:L-lactate dehydrogenase n=1 Tax=Plasmodium relictum TaxID=85471 RepID=A0A1J1H8T2_PLARL|nr:malate dehydrogenase, putative [Plasmodium relictum]CRH00951.1 malate dehydrogenase, putative [Plasmodium relictum]
MTKISLIGSGQIGALVGELCLIENLGDIVLYDVVQGIPQGKCLDLKHFSTILGVNRNILGSNNIEDIKDSDVIVITAGMQRKEGMTREDLIGINGKIMKNVAESVKLYSPNAFVICVSNPLDIMVNVFSKYSNIPHEKVCGMAGILDTSRFRTLLAEKLNVSPENVNAVILGGHGDLMVPVERYCSVSGIPLSDFVNKNIISQKEINEIVEKTRDGGAEIIKLAKASACFAPAAAITKMIKSFLFNQNQLFTCAVYLNGIYNCNDLYVGSTATINSKGAFPVEFPLTKQEQELYDKSIAHVKENTQKAFDMIK